VIFVSYHHGHQTAEKSTTGFGWMMLRQGVPKSEDDLKKIQSTIKETEKLKGGVIILGWQEMFPERDASDDY
jgi:hypothetical protein